MADLTHLRCSPTGLYAEFDTITALEIEDQPLGGGGFGQNYVCRRLNGLPPPRPLVLKILQDNGKGSAQHGRQTLQKMQARLRDLDARRQLQGEPPLCDLPALQGLPQFYFEAERHGQLVCGYGALRLDTAGYVPFDTFAEGDAAQARTYLAMPLAARLQMAADLAQALAILEQIGFVHGDINAQNLFVHLREAHLVLIDFDSGAVVEQAGDQPDTWGKPGDWLAPEIMAQLAGQAAQVKVDRWADAWSAGIGIHYLLFLHHPLVYLKDFGGNTLRQYFARHLWPQIAAQDPLYHPGNDAVYRHYRQELPRLPTSVQNILDVLLNQGTFAPSQRPEGAAWLRALQAAQNPPSILFLVPSRLIAPVGGTLTLTWQTEDADTLYLDGVGEVTGQTSAVVPLRQDGVFTLTATNAFGVVQAATPRIRAVAGPQPPPIRMPIPPPMLVQSAVASRRVYVPSMLRGLPGPVLLSSRLPRQPGIQRPAGYGKRFLISLSQNGLLRSLLLWKGRNAGLLRQTRRLPARLTLPRRRPPF